MISRSELLKKYDIPAPRYTSYPTVPYWTKNPTTSEWLYSLESNLSKADSALSIYVHIPFCESLCTFCGCNTSITKNHLVENPYVDAILTEVSLYKEKIPSLNNKLIRDLHLGGGSPTYLSEQNLEKLIKGLLTDFKISDHSEFSIEVDPRRTRLTQLEVLYQFGFRRISLGVQDFDSEVQRLVNRNQPFEITKEVTDGARRLGYTSINFDLIYGLPKQTATSMRSTFMQTLSLKPDRIAFYSYAHVPWIKPSQRLFTELDLPQAEEKRELYEIGRELLEKEGYIEIGMDHFALKHDALAQAIVEKKLHRNFMGYSNNKTDVMLGFGASAISETEDIFFQNQKLEVKYRNQLHQGEIPNFRGHILNESDKFRKKLILDLMTTWEVEVPNTMITDIQSYLKKMEEDHLLVWEKNRLVVTEIGKPFLRIIGTAFDEKLRSSKQDGSLFSKAI
jgi:coproporphyrinogen III oxidase/oxygen-independent coproporphyrinogen-3 oxidase